MIYEMYDIFDFFVHGAMLSLLACFLTLILYAIFSILVFSSCIALCLFAPLSKVSIKMTRYMDRHCFFNDLENLVDKSISFYFSLFVINILCGVIATFIYALFYDIVMENWLMIFIPFVMIGILLIVSIVMATSVIYIGDKIIQSAKEKRRHYGIH